MTLLLLLLAATRAIAREPLRALLRNGMGSRRHLSCSTVCASSGRRWQCAVPVGAVGGATADSYPEAVTTLPGRFTEPSVSTKVLSSRRRFFAFSWRFLGSGAFRKDPGSILEAPGTLPDQIFIGFRSTCLQVACGSCPGLSGSAGMLPGSAPSLGNPFAGFPWGTAIREEV